LARQNHGGGCGGHDDGAGTDRRTPPRRQLGQRVVGRDLVKGEEQVSRGESTQAPMLQPKALMTVPGTMMLLNEPVT
jgi:hypothetical protein